MLSTAWQVLDEKETMVFKRALDVNYHLKLKASRALFSEINTRYVSGQHPVLVRGGLQCQPAL